MWDGENVNSEKVSKWVASKLKGIASCVKVAFSECENEVIQLLSRIGGKNSISPKVSVVRTPLATRRQRDLRSGVNCDRNSIDRWDVGALSCDCFLVM